MGFKQIFRVAVFALCMQTTIAQELTPDQKESLQHKTAIFMSDNEELQALWYEDLMDRMKLKGIQRDEYKVMVKYHTMKMKSLDDPQNKLSFNRTKAALEKQISMLNNDVKELLDDKQLTLHKNSWDAILKAVLTRIEE